jgi:PPP family 3-phenylpropionic acid transporter
MAVVNLIAQPLWGYLADARLGIKRVMIICMAGSIPVMIMIPPAVGSVFACFLLNILYSFFSNPLQGLTDSLTNITASKNRFVVYGFTRGCGSIAAAFTSLFVGSILDFAGIDKLFFIIAGLTAFGLLLMALFSGASYGVETGQQLGWNHKRPQRISIVVAASELFKNKKYILVVISAVLMNMGNRFALLYVPIMINNFTGTNYHLGFVLFLNCLLMAPCMILHSHLIKHKVSNRIPMLAGGAFAVARVLSLVFVNSLFTLVAVQILQSFAYGLMQPATVQAVGETSPLYLRSTAISLAMAVQIVFSTFLGSNLGSLMAGIIGLHRTLVLCAAITGLGVIVYLCATSDRRKKICALGEAE